MSSSATLSLGDANARRLARRARNHTLLDAWSAAHFGWGLALAVLLGPLWSLVLMVAWEPFEIYVLGPTLSRWGIQFGHETWRNALSDIAFDAAGAALGFVVLLRVWDPMGIL